MLPATVIILVALVALSGISSTYASQKKNFVWVYIDDLRPDLEVAYGRKGVVTPNFDVFAKQPGTVVIEKAFSNYPMCSPSRTSTLFGRLPLATGIMSNLDDEEKIVFDRNLNPSLPKYLQSQGYFTATGGKVFHEPGINGDGCWNYTYDPTTTQPTKGCTQDKHAVRIPYPNTRQMLSPQICITSAPLPSIQDIGVARKAVQTMDMIIQQNAFPFFLAVGFYKPHVPLHVHRTFWKAIPTDLPGPERILAPGPANSYIQNLTFSEDANWVWAVKKSVINLSLYGPKQTIFTSMARRAYAAGVMQSDYAFGIVMDGLRQRNLLANTLIVVISDHGYSLGENHIWAKNALFDNMLRVPMMINVPWLAPKVDPTPNAVNRITTSFFELVDLYRTTTSLLSIGNNVSAVVDGIDQSALIIPAIQNGRETITPVNVGSAVSVVARCSNYDRCDQQDTLVTAIGFSIRTLNYRYNVYFVATPNRTVNWNNASTVIAEELYDHSQDNMTMFDYKSGMTYLNEYVNIAPQQPVLCSLLFAKVKTEFMGNRARFLQTDKI